MENLAFEQLRAANVKRCAAVFHGVNEWSPTDWACALAGEVGEACNLIKKLRRRGPTPETIVNRDSSDAFFHFELNRSFEEIGKELADVVIYADLLAARLGIDLGEAVRAKFDEVSNRMGAKIFLGNGSGQVVSHG